jgi:hypothetical protein
MVSPEMHGSVCRWRFVNAPVRAGMFIVVMVEGQPVMYASIPSFVIERGGFEILFALVDRRCS